MAAAGDASPDVTLSDAAWLSKLSQHPIFTPPSDAHTTSSGDDGRRCCMAIRNADVLVSFGKELRMSSLLEVKHAYSSTSATLNAPPSFRRLSSPTLDFDIHRLNVNPTGNLLACIGSHKVAIVVLPRPGTLSASRRGAVSAKDANGHVNVKAAIVGPYYHHERMGSRARLASVQWHPWGNEGNSLLVMSKEGILREFNVAIDVEEPCQSVSVLSSHLSVSSEPAYPSGPTRQAFRSRSRSQTPFSGVHGSARARRSTSRIAFADDDSASGEDDSGAVDGIDESFYTAAGSIRSSGTRGRTVVSFAFGIDKRASEGDSEDVSPVAADWTPLTIYTLCSNGDLYALCPFMPTSASIPLSYLHSLASYLGLARSASSPDVPAHVSDEAFSVRFLSSLLKQASAHRTNIVRTSTPQKPRRALSATPMSVDEADEVSEAQDETVTVQRPNQSIVPTQQEPQGPFLLTPAPHELSEEREPLAADLFFSRLTRKGEELNVIGIASDDGKVDVCLALEPIRPSWPQSANSSARGSKSNSKPGRYALSDSESDDDVDHQASSETVERLPSLLVYESIDLGLLASLKAHRVDDVEHALRNHPIRFVSDPLYPDIVYVCHSAGAHAIGFGPWTRDLLDAIQSDKHAPLDNTSSSAAAVRRIMHRGTPSDVACIVSTKPYVVQSSSTAKSTKTNKNNKVHFNSISDICIVSDIYLCYSIMALAQSGTLIALELHLRVDDLLDIDGKGKSTTTTATTNELDAHRLTTPSSSSSTPLPYISLLGDGPPFAPPEPFHSTRGLSSIPRTTYAAGADGQAELRVTPDSLRALATTVQSMRGQMREIVRGGNAVQARLELQMDELKRQLGKLEHVHRQIERRRASADEGHLQRRIRTIVERQQSIARRSDRVLQRLVESHSPALSVYESRWLAEMERLEAQLGKASQKEDEESTGLAARVEALRYRLSLLKPTLEHANDSTTTANRQDGEKRRSLLGSKQLNETETMLTSQAKLLSLSREKILHLNPLVRRQLRAGHS